MTTPALREKTKQLGLNYSTACNRLRKMIMFDLVSRLELNYCYRCGDEIENSDELSIDHIEDWLHNDVSLFWDLENIVFSHRLCNTVAGLTGREGHNKIECPPGTAWCPACRSFQFLELFSTNGKNGGRKSYCNPCRQKPTAKR